MESGAAARDHRCMARTRDLATLICGITDESARETTAFAAALARTRGWRLALCPLPTGRPARERLDALVAAAWREDAALAIAPRSDERGWADAFLDVAATAPCPLIAIPAATEPERSARVDHAEREPAWA
jgi:hypothetical protein